MPSPTPSLNLVRLYARYRSQDGTLKKGRYVITVPARLTSAIDDAIVPPGVYAAGDLNFVGTNSYSLDVLVPACDDPDILGPADWMLQVEVIYTDTTGSGGEKFNIRVPYANRPAADGGNGLGVNLRDYAVAAQLVVGSQALPLGRPNGLALLNASGKVVDSDGNLVTGGGGSYDDTALTGRVSTLENAPHTPESVGALSVDWRPTWADVSGKPTIPTTYSQLTGTLPPSALPPLAINEATPVATQAAMLALDAQRGDIAIRTDQNRSYVLSTDSPATLADWKEILATGAVASVAGRTGAVTLAKGDVGLSSVDNTSDANKPVSTAQAAAIAIKPKSLTFNSTTGLYVETTVNFVVGPTTPDPATLPSAGVAEGTIWFDRGTDAP